jgi:prophage regulatory protein
MVKQNEPEIFLRVNQIVGDRAKGIPAIIPVSRSAWWLGVKQGRFPKPLKLSARITVWKMSDIQMLIEKTASKQGRRARDGQDDDSPEPESYYQRLTATGENEDYPLPDQHPRCSGNLLCGRLQGL